jgi:DNA-binding transcriptional LysR family regulator
LPSRSSAHLTRASEAIHLSQPALSSHIKTLEEQFGVMLFERTPSGMTLTPAGRRLLVEAEQIINAVRHLAHSAQDLRGQPTGTLKIGTVLDPSVLRVGELISAPSTVTPRSSSSFIRRCRAMYSVRVRNGTLDAGFFSAPRRRLTSSALPLRDIVYRVMPPSGWADKLRTRRGKPSRHNRDRGARSQLAPPARHGPPSRQHVRPERRSRPTPSP